MSSKNKFRDRVKYVALKHRRKDDLYQQFMIEQLRSIKMQANGFTDLQSYI